MSSQDNIKRDYVISLAKASREIDRVTHNAALNQAVAYLWDSGVAEEHVAAIRAMRMPS